MCITGKNKLSKIGLGLRVPDETLERNTKIPVNDDRNAHKERQNEANATLCDLIKRETKSG